MKTVEVSDDKNKLYIVNLDSINEVSTYQNHPVSDSYIIKIKRNDTSSIILEFYGYGARERRNSIYNKLKCRLGSD